MADGSDSDPRVGTILQDRYRIVARLSAGGMGKVYRAVRLGLDRPVAIKFLHAETASRADLVARFEREAIAMSRLSHPHCVPVIDFGVEDAPYLVLEYVEGEPLGALIDRGPLPAPRALAILRQVLGALAHAHAQGVIHRDIKPDNIVLAHVEGTGDHARLLDFGLAKLSESPAASWSTASIAVGTPSYMSPEQCRGEPVDHRTDLYACGVVLFQMLTGRKPFVAERAMDTLRMHVEVPPPTLAAVAPHLSFSAELEALVAGLLEKDPDRRHPTARAVAEAIAAIEPSVGTGTPVVIESTRPAREDAAARVPPAPSMSPSPSNTEPPPRRRTWPTVLTLFLIAAAGGLVVAWLLRRPPDEHAPAGLPPVDARPIDAPARPDGLSGTSDGLSRTPDASRTPDIPDASRTPDAGPDARIVDGPPLDAAPPPAPDAAPPPPQIPDAAQAIPLAPDAGLPDAVGPADAGGASAPAPAPGTIDA